MCRASDSRVLTMDDLEEAAGEEGGLSTSFRRQDSGAAGMYN